jgi:hypothetical protein
MRTLLRDWQQEVGDTYVLGLVRTVVGVLLFWHALRAARALLEVGYFGDYFHLPFLPEAFVPSRTIYAILLVAELLLAALVTVGHRARPALLVSALLGIYLLLCNRLEYHHNRYALLCFAFLLSFSPCDRAYVITGYPGARIGELWAQRLAQLQLSIIYIASGGAKLLDPDWRAGLVLGNRLALYGHQALEHGVPSCVVAFFSQPDVTSALAKLAIGTELFLAAGLWFRRTRIPALWWGVWFHLTIQTTSSVEGFTWLTLAIYGLFVTPDVQARKLFFDPTRIKGKGLAILVGMLDWFARFEIKPWAPDALRTGHALVIMRRDGSRATGVRALAMVARCVPLLFPLWAPLAFLASFTKGGETSARV